MNRNEKFLLNNPIDAQWIQIAENIANDLSSRPYSHFDGSELKSLKDKLNDAIKSYTSSFGYSYETLLKVERTFSNTFYFRMRDC